MTTRLKNESDADLVLFGPTGHPDAYLCEAGAIVEVQGDISAETDDAFVIGEGDDARSWPKSLWTVTKSDTRRRERAEKTKAVTNGGDGDRDDDTSTDPEE